MTAEGESRSLSRQSLHVLLGRGAGFIFSFAIPLVIVRVLEPDIFGQYKQYFLIANTFVQIADIGLPASLFYFLPGNADRKPQFVAGVSLVLGFVALLGSSAAWLAGDVLAGWLQAPELASVMPLLGIFAGLRLITQYAESLPLIEQRSGTAGIVAFGSEFLKAGCLIGGALVGQSLLAIAWASVIYGMLRLAYQVSYTLWLYGRSLFSLSRQVIRQTLRYSLPFGAAAVLSTLLRYIHEFYVAAETDPSTFAVYAIGCFNIPLTFLLYSTLADVALIRVTEYYKRGQHDQAHLLFRSVQRRLGACFIPAFAFIAAFAEPTITVLFTNQYVAAAPIMIAYSSGMLLYTFADHVILRAYSETTFILKANAIGLLFTTTFVVVLYQTFGLPGAALGYVVGLLSQRLAGLWRISRLLGQSMRDLVPVRDLAKMIGVAGIAASLARLGVEDLAPIKAILVGGGILSAVYALLVWYADILNDEEKDRLIRFVRRLTL